MEPPVLDFRIRLTDLEDVFLSIKSLLNSDQGEYDQVALDLLKDTSVTQPILSTEPFWRFFDERSPATLSR